MKKNENKGELRDEYNLEQLGEGSRGKYYKDYKLGNNLILLDPEVAKVFPTEKSVNDALKSLIKVAQSSVGQ